MRFDVFGMCNALFDIQAEVTDRDLEELGFPKGGMSLIDQHQHEALLPRLAGHIVNHEAGGSGANTMIGVAMLGGRTCFTSRVADDEYGILYRASLQEKQVQANLGHGSGHTGVSVILITPDKQRTMCTHLGVSRDLTRAEVSMDDLAASRCLYVTGYLWDTFSQKEAVTHAMGSANRLGVQVAMSLSDPFCVNRHLNDFKNLIEKHVDVVMGNGDEAMALTGCAGPEEAAMALASVCKVAVVTMDSRGSLVATGGSLHRVPVWPADLVDTTGAGDMFAAGMLYGLTQGLAPERAGMIGAETAARVVSKLGPRLDALDRTSLESLR